MLEIKDLSVRYGKQEPTIEHFNLNMKKGEIISVVGESGSGKTTVIRAVLGALAGGGKVTQGDILFNGKSLLTNTKDEWRQLRGTRISMIFQDCGGTLNPIRKIGSQFVEYICTHSKVSKDEAWKKWSKHAGENASPGSREYHEQLSSSAFRWYASACGYCHGNDL